MKNILLMIVSLMLMNTAFAAGGGAAKRHAHIDINDKLSLQRGLKMYTNYCAGCHSAEYLRYERLVEDLDIAPNLVAERIAFSGVKLGQTMDSAIDKAAAAKWFGKVPPDLTNMTRLRGNDYVYSYLTGFYPDAARPYGYNNDTLANAAMPHVMLNYEKSLVAELGEKEGKAAFDSSMNDLTNFMAYMAEPTKAYSSFLGKIVLGFLALLGFFCVWLNKEFWKDIH